MVGKGVVNQALASYIYNSLHQGYPLASIKQQLFTQGYSQKEVNGAIDYVYATYYHSQSNSDPRPTYMQAQTTAAGSANSPLKILLPVLVVIAVAVFGFAFVFILGSNSSEVDTIHTEPAVFDRPSTDDSVDDPIPVLDTPSSSGTPTLDEPRDVEVIVAEINPLREVYNVNKAYTKRQIDERVSALATDNPREAIQFCDAYDYDDQIFICYGIVATKSTNAAYCSQITSEKYRDDCYLGMVVDTTGSTAECELIDNAYKRDNCRRLAEINAQILSFEDAAVQPSQSNPEDAINYVAVTADLY
jgi:hypothetical protein